MTNTELNTVGHGHIPLTAWIKDIKELITTEIHIHRHMDQSS